MTSPIFFIVSTNTGKLKSTMGVLTSTDWSSFKCRSATLEESAAIKAKVMPCATKSLRNAIIEGTYSDGSAFRVFDTRKDGRAAVKELNNANTCFDWVLVQIGKEQRDLTRKPKGYQIVYGDPVVASAWNPRQNIPLNDGITDGICDEYSYILTRAEARRTLSLARSEDSSMGYRLRTLYA